MSQYERKQPKVRPKLTQNNPEEAKMIKNVPKWNPN